MNSRGSTTGRDVTTAVVTGVTDGNIGAAIAVALADRGHDLVIVDRLAGSSTQCEEAIGSAGRRVTKVVADLMDEEGVDALMTAVAASGQRLAVLVNTVGGMREPATNVWELSERAWTFTMNLNLRTTFLCTRAALAVMIQQQFGSIVNIASIDAGGSIEHAHYAAAKAGVVAFSRSCALQVAQHGVRVNVVSPGATLTTSVISAGILRRDQDWDSAVPLGRPNDPGDVAEAVAYLCSEAARNITGIELVVAGGQYPVS